MLYGDISSRLGGGGSVTTLETFEDGAWPDDWTGDTGGYTLNSTTPIDGTYSLDPTTDTSSVANSAYPTTRDGTEYRTKFRFNASTDSASALLAFEQSASGPFVDCYFVMVSDGGTSYTDCDIGKRVGGSTSWLETLNPGLSTDTVYEMGFSATSSTITAAIYDADGNVVADFSDIADTSHSGGYLGYYQGSAVDITFDTLTSR